MAAKVHSLILWQSHHSGLWACEIHDCHTGELKGIGLGQSKLLAQLRAARVAKMDSRQILTHIGDTERSLEQLDDLPAVGYERQSRPAFHRQQLQS